MAKLALALSLALLLLVGVVTLSHAPLRVMRANPKPQEQIASTTGTPMVCQSGETLPGGVSAIRLDLEASFGPSVVVRAYSGSRVLTEGRRGANWTGTSVTVPVRSLATRVTDVTLCLSVLANGELLHLDGVPTVARQAAVANGGVVLPGRMSVEYLASGHGSWFSRAATVVRHMGVGHAIGGSWVALLALVLVAAASALVVGLAWRELP